MWRYVNAYIILEDSEGGMTDLKKLIIWSRISLLLWNPKVYHCIHGRLAIGLY
jgi:hypothetical protein